MTRAQEARLLAAKAAKMTLRSGAHSPSAGPVPAHGDADALSSAPDALPLASGAHIASRIPDDRNARRHQCLAINAGLVPGNTAITILPATACLFHPSW